jgi:hypothetical protein
MASEYHGTVKVRALPVPGATVTATRDGRKLATTTDAAGTFAFADLADGVWTLAVEMAGFRKFTREVGVAPNAPSPECEMEFVAESTLRREGPLPQRFERRDLTRTADGTAGESTLKAEEIADLTPSSANSFLVQGSISSAVGLAQQNDWGPGRLGWCLAARECCRAVRRMATVHPMRRRRWAVGVREGPVVLRRAVAVAPVAPADPVVLAALVPAAPAPVVPEARVVR